MEKIQFDSGIREYALGAGVLRFNPADPNVYARFMEAAEKLREMEERLGKESPENGEQTLVLLCRADREIKELLSGVFGGDNDFQSLLQGVNLLAVAGNGQPVIANLLTALEPILVAGAEACAFGKTQEAVEKARRRRAKRS